MLYVFQKKLFKSVELKLKHLRINYRTMDTPERVILTLEKEGNDGITIPEFETMNGFIKMVPLDTPYPLVSSQTYKKRSIVTIGDQKIGGKDWTVIAGPCSIESYDQARQNIKFLIDKGIKIIRGGIFKPRTSPYSFQGLREKGIEIISDLKKEFNFYFISELLSPTHIKLLEPIVDVWQVGTRSMANYELLKILSQIQKPVLLKRGVMATIEEWLLAAEYLLQDGNCDIILCERGIRSFETMTRYTFDINAIPLIKELSHLPIIADPSHAVGKRSLVPAVARAALAAGADGVMVEVHPDPENALSDADQSIEFAQFELLLEQIHILKNIKRKI